MDTDFWSQVASLESEQNFKPSEPLLFNHQTQIKKISKANNKEVDSIKKEKGRLSAQKSRQKKVQEREEMIQEIQTGRQVQQEMLATIQNAETLLRTFFNQSQPSQKDLYPVYEAYCRLAQTSQKFKTEPFLNPAEETDETNTNKTVKSVKRKK